MREVWPIDKRCLKGQQLKSPLPLPGQLLGARAVAWFCLSVAVLVVCAGLGAVIKAVR